MKWTVFRSWPALAHFSIHLPFPITLHCVIPPLLPTPRAWWGPPKGDCCRPSSAPRDMSQPLPGRRSASTEVIKRACSQERWRLFTIVPPTLQLPTGCVARTLSDFWSKCILPSMLVTGATTFKRFRRKTNYMIQRLPDKYVTQLITSSMA